MYNHVFMQTCSSFLAGDSLRSSTRYHALDETALFGCACRQEFPRLFVNLKAWRKVCLIVSNVKISSLHCYRLAYGVWLMNELSQGIPSNVKPVMMYDIACNLVRHLQVSKDGAYLLEQWKFALPSFHAYGHVAACQVSVD